MSLIQIARSDRGSVPLIPIVVVAVIVIGIAVLVITAGDDVDSDDPAAYGEVAVEGSALPPFEGDGPDAAVGSPAPVVEGQDPNGDSLAFRWDDGRPTVVLFLAHWCGFCQEEVPMVVDVDDDDGIPVDVDLVAVATGTDPGRDRFPPGEWLAEEGWPFPTVMDDPEGTVGQAFGLSGFPFWVLLDGDGEVLGRFAGAVGPDAFRQIVGALAAEAADTG